MGDSFLDNPNAAHPSNHGAPGAHDSGRSHGAPGHGNPGHGNNGPSAFGRPATFPQGPAAAPWSEPKNRSAPSRVRRFEGLRGNATRGAVYARYIVSFLAIILCAAINRAGLDHISVARDGWKLLVGAVAFQLVTAAIGSMAYANKRHEIIEQVRHYVFGLTLFPVTGLALFIWALRPLTAGNGPNPSGAIQTLESALPYLYYLPMILVTIVFTKTIAGMRGFDRVTMDDEEMMLTMTRQDRSFR